MSGWARAKAAIRELHAAAWDEQRKVRPPAEAAYGRVFGGRYPYKSTWDGRTLTVARGSRLLMPNGRTARTIMVPVTVPASRIVSVAARARRVSVTCEDGREYRLKGPAAMANAIRRVINE